MSSRSLQTRVKVKRLHVDKIQNGCEYFIVLKNDLMKTFVYFFIIAKK